MDRRAFIAGTIGLLAAPLAAEAQAAGKKFPTLGILGIAAGAPAGPVLLTTFFQGLQDQGWSKAGTSTSSGALPKHLMSAWFKPRPSSCVSR